MTYSHPEYARLLAAVLAEPQEDAPRLVLADWLLEFGDGQADALRGEFIQVQVELARYPAIRSGGLTTWGSDEAALDALRDEDPQREKLMRRERELLGEHGKYWAEPVARAFGAERWGYGGPTCGPRHALAKVNWDWHRGFIDQVVLPTQAFLDHAATLFGREPITRVTLSNREPLQVAAGFAWGNDDALRLPHSLPGVIWECLRSHVFSYDDPFGYLRGYRPACQTARDALSDACVIHGRRLARVGVGVGAG